MVFLGLNTSLDAQNQGQRIMIDQAFKPFYHGVASGDPLTDRVIIWTRVTPDAGQTGSLTGSWKMATDTTFSTIINSGSYSTDSTRDYTVKVDVTGLQPNSWYYYRFTDNQGINSVIGRTKTAPAGGVDSLRFGVVSCASYEHGFFNAYGRLKARNDVDAILHLGDYIYEYAKGGYGDTTIGRFHEPTNEILSLSDYRIRHSHYKLDKDLRELHQQYPFITVWDDHETANDSYRDGAENHTPSSEGDWHTRKINGVTAYKEWQPIREPDPNDTVKIWRTIPYGNLMNLYMMDTRLYDRDEQVGATSGQAGDTTRNMIGPDQLNWLKAGLTNSTAKWNILGQQVMFAPLKIGGVAVNMDQWDGYAAERKRIMDHVMNNNIKNIVVLTGDIHTSWANDIPYNNYNSSTGAGSMGVEYVVTSVTSGSSPLGVPQWIIQSQNSHMKFIDLSKKGYLILDVNNARIQGEWFFVDKVTAPSTNEAFAEAWYCNDNERFLRKATAPSVRVGTLPVPAPALPNNTTSRAKADEIIWLSQYPNPFTSDFAVQYYLQKAGKVDVKVFDVQGKVVLSESRTAVPGIQYTEMNGSSLPSGIYMLTIQANGQSLSRKIVKQ